MKNPWGRRLLALAVVGAALVGAYWLSPSIDSIANLLNSWKGGGSSATFAFMGFFLVGTLLVMPASWLQGTAGFLYGPVVGFFVAWGLSTLFGYLSFRLAKGALRGRVQRALEARAGKLLKLDEAIETDGFKVVCLVRMSPVSPYNIMNYLLGFTSVSSTHYLLGSAVGDLVPALLWSQVGASVSDVHLLLVGQAAGPSWVRWVGLVFTVVVTIGVTRFATKALGTMMK